MGPARLRQKAEPSLCSRVLSGFLSGFLDVGLEEPELFVERPRKGGQDVGRIGVAGFIRRVDRRADRICDAAEPVDQGVQVIGDLINIGGVGRYSGLLSHDLGRAEGGASQLDHPLCHSIDMRIDLGAKLVEHFMDGDELQALEIPMRLLGQKREVDRIGKACVQGFDRNGLGIRLEIVLGLVSL